MDDRKTKRRRALKESAASMPWILSGVAALAVLVAVFVMLGNNRATNLANDVPKGPGIVAPTPSTTGSAIR